MAPIEAIRTIDHVETFYSVSHFKLPHAILGYLLATSVGNDALYLFPLHTTAY